MTDPDDTTHGIATDGPATDGPASESPASESPASESPAMDGVVRVVAIDDHPAVRAGVVAWCQGADPPIEVVAAGPDLGAAWVEPGRSTSVVIMDLHLIGGRPAYTDLGRLVSHGRQVIIYSMSEDTSTALTCLELGASPT